MIVSVWFQIVVLALTAFVSILHPFEWLEIRRSRAERDRGLSANKRLGFLKKGLDVESCYYILVFGYLLVFYRELVLLSLVLVMALAHAAARRSLSGGLSMVSDRKHVAGVLAFDAVELVFLAFLFLQLWPSGARPT